MFETAEKKALGEVLRTLREFSDYMAKPVSEVSSRALILFSPTEVQEIYTPERSVLD